MNAVKTLDWRARSARWKAKAERMERVAKAAAEFEYREHMNYQTYTNKTAAEIAQKNRDEAFSDLQWALRNALMFKRD